MQFVIIAACVVVFLAAAYILFTLAQRKKMIRRLCAQYGTPPQKEYGAYGMESIASYWTLTRAAADIPCPVDDITWRDLNMDGVFDRINAACSSAGEEMLYFTLRNQQPDPERLGRFEQTVLHFDQNEKERLRAQMALTRLGRVTGNGVAGFFMHPDDKKLPGAGFYPLLSLCAVLSLLSLIWLHASGILSVVIMFVLNIVVYYRTKSSVEEQLVSLRYIASLLGCAGQLAGKKGGLPKEQAEALAALVRPLRRIGTFAAFSMGNPASDTDFITEYIRIFFMLDFLSYNQMLHAILKHREECLALYRTVGKIDAAIAVTSFRKSLPFFCRPDLTDSQEAILQGVVHPLLEGAVPNSVTLSRSALLTGSNASGKSTFIKAVAVNAILAQTIGTCTAQRFSLCPSLVVTSMAVNDDLSAGESYFIAEIKSLRRILTNLNSGVRCLCFIDEILKGTNTVERIAASAAVLRYLRDKNCLCMTATHDIELTELMGADYDNYHFEERVEDGEVHFDFKLRPGRATTKNAIKLLEVLRYPDEVTGLARALADRFEADRVWDIGVQAD